MAKKYDVSKKMDILLGRPPVSGSSNHKELSEKEDELLNLRVKLQNKEKYLNEKESKLNKETKELETNILGLKKERAKLWEDIEELKMEEENSSSHLFKINEEIRVRKKEIKQADEIHDLLEKKQKKFKEREEDIKEREYFIAEKEKETVKLNRDIKDKEEIIHRLSKMINTERTQFEHDRKIIAQEIDELQKRKTLLNAEVAALKDENSAERKRLDESMRDVKQMYDLAEKKILATDRRAKDIEAVLYKKENDLTKFSLNLDKREMELKEWAEQLEKERSRLLLEQKEEVALRKNIVELSTEERLLEQSASEKRKQLEDFEADYETKKEDLKRDQAMLDDKEDEIIRRIKQLEDDERLLAEKEEEFIDKITELEKDRRLFDKKAAEFSEMIGAVKEVKNKEAELSKRELDIEAKEQKIAKVSETRVNISNLKKEKETLAKELKHLQSRVAKANEINKKLSARERMLSEQEEKLKAIFSHMSGEDANISSVPQTPYELENKQDEIRTTYEAVEETNPKNYSVISLMQDARSALISKNIVSAKQLYSRINSMYKKLPATAEKKRLYYEILELKTDIELAGV
ncbi:TPA: hypothetical protein HA219_04335 [Candidatus Woesearchaeota archaeon]|nr:hypothetical protein [uncultured archaeon]AQS32088.1 hypothetical protein [uncultured archaeon]MBS3115282.1 hypothetical protein [Candidatus Woesearchaeota archaeon]HIH39918.1 hypothetical protein [Candidatus Woesearchaeota archaeon]